MERDTDGNGGEVGDPKTETKWQENSWVWAVILKCDFDANLAGQAAAPPGIPSHLGPVPSSVLSPVASLVCSMAAYCSRAAVVVCGADPVCRQVD